MSGESVGFDYILKVNTGTVAVPEWTKIASGGRGMSFNPSTTMVDVSSKAGPFRNYLSGMHDETISFDGLFVRSSDDFTLLKSAEKAREMIQVMRAEAATHGGAPVDIEWAYALISGMSQDFPYEGAATISLELQVVSADGQDPWTAA